MTLLSTKQIHELKKAGVVNFFSEEDLMYWVKWECDDKQLEKRIKTILNDIHFTTPVSANSNSCLLANNPGNSRMVAHAKTRKEKTSL